MSNKLIAFMTFSLLPIFLLGCSNHGLIAESKNDTLKNTFDIKKPIKIATWSPDVTDGRFTAMTAGRLEIIENCLTLKTGQENVVLVLVDNSFSWDSEKEILKFQGNSYRIGDELYLGGGFFTYNPDNLPSVKIHWQQCGLKKGWLAS